MPAAGPGTTMNRHSPFVGRVAELSALEEALAAAILGRGGAVMLAGEPGIGKTRLAAELCERAERRGARVLWSRCASDAGAPPYWPFAQLLRPLYDDEGEEGLLQRFGPGASDARALWRPAGATGRPGTKDHGSAHASGADQQRFRLFDAVTSMLLAAAVDRPAVLVFDDIHAADPGCLHLLVFLVRALRRSRVLVVATTRSAEARRPEVAPILLGDLAREALALSLDGWSREEVGAFLVQGGGRSATASLLDSVHRASAGNPFFVGEIASMIQPGDVAVAFPLPAHARQALLARIDVLPAKVADVLKAASVLGLTFDTRTLAALLREDASDLARLLAEATEAGFLERGTESTWSFRHEIAHEVLLEFHDSASRRALHLRIADVLERTTPGSEGIAFHLLAALPRGRVLDAARRALAAGEAAASALAYERAASWMTRGLAALAEHADLEEDRTTTRELRGRLLLALGDASWAAGDFVASRRAFEDAASLAEKPGTEGGTTDALLLARAALGLGGRQQRAHVQFDASLVALLERAVAALGEAGEVVLDDHRDVAPGADAGAAARDGDHVSPGGRAAWRARLLARLAYSLYAAPDSRDEREDHCAEALTLARAAGDEDALRWVLGDRRWALWGPANLDERRAIGDELLAIAQKRRDREAVLVEQGWRIVDGLETGDRNTVDEAFAAYRGGATELRLPWFDWYATRFACLLAQVEGRLDDAERLALEALAAGQRAGHPDAALAFGSQMLGIRLAQDRLHEAEGALEASVAQYPDVALWRRLLARLRLAQGREAEAAGEVERVRNGPLVEAPGDFLHLPSLVMLAELAVAVGDDVVCRRVYQMLTAFSGRQVTLGFGMAWLGPVDQILGELAAACGAVAEARAHFEAAAMVSMRLGAPRAAARARASARTLGEPRTPATAASVAAQPGATAIPAGAIPRHVLPFPVQAGEAVAARLEREGSSWKVEFGTTRFRLGDLRGLTYLRALVEHPDREIHVLELAALGGEPTGARSVDSVEASADRGDAGPALDDRAKRAYRTRLAELRAELDEATDFADRGRMAAARAEIEALEDELTRAVGLGGRDRPTGGSAERARVAVAKRIRAALERIGEESPELQRYLDATVRTGAFCVYRPDPGRPVDWKS